MDVVAPADEAGEAVLHDEDKYDDTRYDAGAGDDRLLDVTVPVDAVVPTGEAAAVAEAVRQQVDEAVKAGAVAAAPAQKSRAGNRKRSILCVSYWLI